MRHLLLPFFGVFVLCWSPTPPCAPPVFVTHPATSEAWCSNVLTTSASGVVISTFGLPAAATLISATLPPSLFFRDALFGGVYSIFGYMSGNNANHSNIIKTARTVPLIVRPLSPYSSPPDSWVVSMLVSTAEFPVASGIPAASPPNVLEPLAQHTFATLDFAHTPQPPLYDPPDFPYFLDCGSALAAGLPGGWAIKADSIWTPAWLIFTGDDYTAYFQTLEKSRLPVSFELEADRMRNLKLLPEEFTKEQQVVLEERRLRTDDQPRAKLGEQFSAVAFTNSPYRNPVIGWPDDVSRLTVGDLSEWYQRWYAPNNATLVVVGDVQPQAVFDLAEKYFAELKPSDIKALKPQLEIEQLGVRKITVKVPAKLPSILMGYKVPVLKTAEHEWEAYALEVLAGVLDGGSSARLSSALVRGKQIAVSAGASYGLTSRLADLFELEATPAEGKTVQELEAALKNEVTKLQQKLIDNDELQRIKAQVLASAVYERDSIFYQAMQIGMLETVGLGWQKADDYVGKINQITAEQVREVARKYLIEDHLNIAYLEPQLIKTAEAIK